MPAIRKERNLPVRLMIRKDAIFIHALVCLITARILLTLIGANPFLAGDKTRSYGRPDF